MQIPRNKLDSLIKELKEVTGMEFFLFDPNSMTQAELKEQEERVKEHQEKITKINDAKTKHLVKVNK